MKRKKIKKELENTEKTVEEPLSKTESQEIEDFDLPLKDMLLVLEVANYFRVEKKTIKNWMDNGFFDECYKVHGSLRIRRSSVIRFMKVSRVYRTLVERRNQEHLG